MIGTEYLFAPCPELLRKPARTLLQLAERGFGARLDPGQPVLQSGQHLVRFRQVENDEHNRGGHLPHAHEDVLLLCGFVGELPSAGDLPDVRHVFALDVGGVGLARVVVVHPLGGFWHFCLVRVQEAADQRGLARALRSDDEEDGVGPALVSLLLGLRLGLHFVLVDDVRPDVLLARCKRRVHHRSLHRWPRPLAHFSSFPKQESAQRLPASCAPTARALFPSQV
mmetsp:Transcript_4581/g.11315  ORF Transcript_4581/g.11315 Transcript_4581/m.11315 type:complete len:225 (+) Transcript_4581:864-1538(+)